MAPNWDDFSWWKQRATPEPQPDKGAAICGGDYDPATGGGRSRHQQRRHRLWGNRGVVYHCWEKPVFLRKGRTPVLRRHAKKYFQRVLFDFDKSVLKRKKKR